jgi:glucans biosynthesis protein
MFMFGPNDRDGIDDYRPAAGDADGLAVANAHGEVLWRPLVNPRELQVSVFGDAGPRGFGLMQRRRSFFDYQDLEARYERRPSVCKTTACRAASSSSPWSPAPCARWP